MTWTEFINEEENYEDKYKNNDLIIYPCLIGHDYPNTFYCSYVDLCNF